MQAKRNKHTIMTSLIYFSLFHITVGPGSGPHSLFSSFYIENWPYVKRGKGLAILTPYRLWKINDEIPLHWIWKNFVLTLYISEANTEYRLKKYCIFDDDKPILWNCMEMRKRSMYIDILFYYLSWYLPLHRYYRYLNSRLLHIITLYIHWHQSCWHKCSRAIAFNSYPADNCIVKGVCINSEVLSRPKLLESPDLLQHLISCRNIYLYYKTKMS